MVLGDQWRAADAAGCDAPAGVTGSFEEAQAELKENWAKWLAWAKLQEISE
jgi:hypothetical protein